MQHYQSQKLLKTLGLLGLQISVWLDLPYYVCTAKFGSELKS